MTRTLPRAKKLVIGVAALGTVALGTAGVAGAAATTTNPQAARHFNCARAPKVLAHIGKVESDIAAGLPKLHAAETKAQQKGNTKRVDRLKKRISRLESPAYKARLDKQKSKIEAKCQVNAPATWRARCGLALGLDLRLLLVQAGLSTVSRPADPLLQAADPFGVPLLLGLGLRGVDSAARHWTRPSRCGPAPSAPGRH